MNKKDFFLCNSYMATTKMFSFVFDNLIEHAITLIVTVFTPLLTKELIIPYMMNPFRLGGIPFKAPSPIGYMFLYLIVSCCVVGSASMVAESMSSTKKCNKTNIWSAIRNTKWTSFFLIFGLTILLHSFKFIHDQCLWITCCRYILPICFEPINDIFIFFAFHYSYVCIFFITCTI